MFKIWGKVWQNNHLLKDIVISDDSDSTRTTKVFGSLKEICHEFDLAEPIWLDANIREFKKHARTRFGHDSFIEDIDFDFLEIMILEED